ncbi:hypothetical protein OOK58_42565 [Streptomyces sp. NBC_01728]|uniref:hypothetical protein n=1 Tax=Streptomyces TaxID=1883 RepID=UPI0022529B2D|nr:MULTISPECIES: hypothetical protein [Streptomyces]MCX4458596.1 hypothetical protein [Streptomyces sp. NBC_01719]MCX4497953.1 hypothetical protein [Streptomyces sp. NBC_01728]MCX4609425.1 hypothetical protein [Streptomyces mirabilis]
MDWQPRPTRLPDAHLPHGVSTGQPTCRACATAWPCETAGEHLRTNRCVCGAASHWEKNGPRNWHAGPRCYTDAEAVSAQAAELSAARTPHYPPSHFYPPKPSRRVRQRPPYRHTPAGPGDLQSGTWVWVSPGGLHPGWGDIHHLAMVTQLGTPKCELWLHLDGTVHEARADLLILESSVARQAARAAGLTTLREPGRRRRPLLAEWRWVDWTVAEHLAHREQRAGAAAAEEEEGFQETLFSVQD